MYIREELTVELRQFLAEWLTHATHKQQTPPFKNHAGLCTNLALWCEHYNKPNRQELSKGLLDLLYNEFGITDYPFGKEDYFQESRSESHHSNKKRVLWVKEKLNIS